MTHESNPKPLLQDAACSEDMRSLLTFAREQRPAQVDLDRLARRLSPLVGVSPDDLSVPSSDGGLGSAPTHPPGMGAALGAAGKGSLAKLGMSSLAKTMVAAGLVSAGAMWWAMPTPNAAKPAPSIMAPRVQEAPVQVAPQPSEAVVPEVQVPEPRVESEPAVAPVRAVRAVRARATQPRVIESAVVAPSELELIRRAEELRAQPVQALRALSEHERLYPTGMLAQEREVLAIEALVASGQRPVAEARAASLAAAHPGSAHLRRVRVLLGAGSRD